MGDGLALERYDGQEPTNAVLDQVRVEGAQRAAITTNGAKLDVKSTVLACNQRGLVEATGIGQAVATAGAVCGCGEKWSECTKAVEPLDSWVLAGPSAVWPNAVPRSVTYTGSGTNSAGTNWITPEPGITYWAPRSPEVAPGLTDADGYLLSHWVSSSYIPLAHWKLGYTTEIDQFVSGYMTSQPLQLLQYTAVGEPTFSAFYLLERVPTGSHIKADGMLLDVLGNPLPGNIARDPTAPTPPTPADGGSSPDASAPGGAPAMIYFIPLEPGWHKVELDSLPRGVVCGPPSNENFELGMNANPAVRIARADWGLMTHIDYVQCALTATQ
jgi:hypothetical protein